MAWTSPRTWVTSEIVTAAMLNTHIRDNENYLKGASGGIAFDSGASFNGGLSIAGQTNQNGILQMGNAYPINMGSGSRLRFPTETGLKIDFTSLGDQVAIGVATSTLWYKADGNHSWRDQNDIERMKLTTGGSPQLSVGGQNVPVQNGVTQGGLNSDTLRGYVPGNANGNVPVSNGTVNTNLNADLLDGLDWSAFALASHTHGSPVATGTYTGDGSTSNRVFSTGFQPKLAIIGGGSATASIEVCVLHSTSGCARFTSSGMTFQGACKLDPSGILVGGGANFGNVSGVAYAYAAFP